MPEYRTHIPNRLELILAGRSLSMLPTRDVSRSDFMRLAIESGMTVEAAGRDADVVARTRTQRLFAGEFVGIEKR